MCVQQVMSQEKQVMSQEKQVTTLYNSLIPDINTRVYFRIDVHLIKGLFFAHFGSSKHHTTSYYASMIFMRIKLISIIFIW